MGDELDFIEVNKVNDILEYHKKTYEKERTLRLRVVVGGGELLVAPKARRRVALRVVRVLRTAVEFVLLVRRVAVGKREGRGAGRVGCSTKPDRCSS